MIFREFLWISLFQVWNVYVFGVKINPPKISHEMVLESNGNQRVARNEKSPFERAMKWKQKKSKVREWNEYVSWARRHRNRYSGEKYLY